MRFFRMNSAIGVAGAAIECIVALICSAGAAHADAVIDRWRAITAEYPIPQPPPDATRIYPTSTSAEIASSVSGAADGTAFLVTASAPDTTTTYRRWSVTPKTNQKFYGELHSDGRTRLIMLKGSKDVSPGVVAWTQNANGIWYCTETGPLGTNPQADRYPPGYQRNAYGRAVIIDGNNWLNHLWPPSSTDGQLVTIEISNAGSGYQPGTYTNIALRPTSGANGTSATATVVVSAGGQVTSVTLTAGGQGYDGKNVTGTIPGGGSGWQCKVDDFVRALTASSPDAFCLDDPANKLYLGFNPAGHTVEIMTDTDCFNSAAGVEICNLRVQQYANPISDKPVAMGAGGRIEYVEASYNHAGGVQVAKNGTLKNCLLAHNGQRGYNGPTANNAVVEGNEMAFNNSDLGEGNFINSWDSGGGKMTNCTNVTMRNNYVHDNGGPGIWWDINVGLRDGTGFCITEGNICDGNTNHGIMHEISHSALIRGNYCRNNGSKDINAQILIAESGPVNAYGNIAEIGVTDTDGIEFRQGNREADQGGQHYCVNNNIHHNEVIFRIPTGGDVSGGYSSWAAQKANFFNQLPPFGNNRFDWNTYHVLSAGAKNWRWWDNTRTFDEFKAYGFETSGVVVLDGAAYVDTTPPAAPPAPTVTGGAPTSPTLSGVTEMAAMIRVYEGGNLITTTFADENGVWSVTVTGLSPINHRLYVTATDPWKNVSGQSPPVSTMPGPSGSNVLRWLAYDSVEKPGDH